MIFILCIGMYFYRFGDLKLSYSQDIWGQFGDYLGGTLNPILSFLSLVALLFTIIIQSNQLKQMQSSLKVSERPWLSVKVLIDENFIIDNENISFNIKYLIKNVGKSPAINCDITNQLESFMDGDYIKKLSQEYESIKKQKGNKSVLGNTIFPNEEAEFNFNLNLSFDKIKTYNANFRSFGDNLDNKLMFSLVLLSFVSYKSTLDSECHVTSCLGHIYIKNERPGMCFVVDLYTGGVNYSKCYLQLDPFISGVTD